MAAAAAHPRPGAASPARGYAGSRREAQRYEYSRGSLAGFIELAAGSLRAFSWEARFVASNVFFDELAKVPGVASAPWGAPPRSWLLGRDALATCLAHWPINQ